MEDLIVRKDGGILWAVINRPKKANSLSQEVSAGFVEATREVARDPSLLGMILTSQGSDIFSAGVDLSVPDGLTPLQISELRTTIIFDMLRAALSCPRPLVVMTQGRMMGGAFLTALLCDRIVATPGAEFSLPELKIGIGSPIAAAIVRSAANNGLAYDLLLSARVMRAAELAQAGGPCSVADGDLRRAAVDTVKQYAAMPPDAFAYMKQWFQRGRLAALEEALDYTNATRPGRKDEVSDAARRFG